MSNRIPKATHGDPNNPMPIGGVQIPVYVLDDGRRVLSMRGMVSSIGMKSFGTAANGVPRLARFIEHKDIKPYISNELSEKIRVPIEFKPPHGGRTAHGYEASLLMDFCEVLLAARRDAVLSPVQMGYADQCEILQGAFARVGLDALIDEWTGYQEIRDRRALQEILDKYLRQEHAKWSKRFPDEFYKLIFEMRGWRWRGMSVNRPSVVGKYTNDIIWSRLAPNILKKLERLNPKDDTGQRKVKHHMFLTENIGHPRLQEHLHATMALMRASGGNWGNFMRSLQRAFPKVNTNLELPFEDDGAD